MQEILSKLADIVKSPYQRLSRWKEQTGGKVIGCLPMYIPEELIHAAGLLPVAVLAGEEEFTLVDKYIEPYLCSVTRSKFDMVLRGELDFLDGMVFPDVCEFTQQLPDIWMIHWTGAYQYVVPLVKGNFDLPSRKHYLMEQFTGFRASLEKFFGQEITDQRLRQSIAIYNHNRALLSRLYQVRRSNPGLFHAKDMVTIVTASMFMPKEEHSELLTKLLARVEGAKPAPDGRLRLVLSGNLCNQPVDGILKLIDELDIAVVDDGLYTGRRYFTDLVDETLDPIEALAERYISGMPCTTKQDPNGKWADYLLSLVKESEAKGVIMLIVRFCEPHGFDYPYLKQSFAEAGVPLFLVETELRGALEPIRTRLQAFTETLREV